jgi:hypothetical protein
VGIEIVVYGLIVMLAAFAGGYALGYYARREAPPSKPAADNTSVPVRVGPPQATVAGWERPGSPFVNVTFVKDGKVVDRQRMREASCKGVLQWQGEIYGFTLAAGPNRVYSRKG